MGRLEALEDQIQAELELPGTEARSEIWESDGKRAGGSGCGAFKDPGGAGGERRKLLRREQLEKAAEETERLSEDCQKQAGD